ncbi:MAG TPA: ATP-binding cassette domain-containing protein [Acidobacteriota bacterium]|nr:ATP-binding cassette domain-containing protein [Acidobacteriota bacterium]
MISLQRVSKSFGRTTALKAFSLEVLHGKTTILLGQSGCGKSTLIRIVTGLVQPDSGAVTINGEALSSTNILGMRRNIGYVIQQGGLFPHLTARRNVALMAQYLGWSKMRIDSRIRQLAELTKFPPDGLDRFPAQLSGGQNQRVSLMRALMLDPGILLLDEPLGALDPLIRFELQRDLKEIFQTLKKTVILVTHDIGEAAYFGDWIVLMKDGSIVQQGTIRDMIERPTEPFVVQFIQAQRSPLDSMREGK